MVLPAQFVSRIGGYRLDLDRDQIRLHLDQEVEQAAAISFGNPGESVFAHLRGELKDAVEQRIGGRGQIEKVCAPVLRVWPALDQTRRLQPVEQAGEGDRFELEELLPEAGQGALALQVRAGEEHLVAAADDPATREQVEAERTVVAIVGGGCLAPVAAHHDGATLTGLVAAEDGSWLERTSGEDAQTLGEELAAIAAERAAPAP